MATGGSRTVQTFPEYRFDTRSVAHNIINMTAIPTRLDLSGTGLHYMEMDPFAAGVAPGRPVLRFFRAVDATVAGLAEEDPEESARYARWMDWALPTVEAAVALLDRRGWHGGASAVVADLRAFREIGGLAATAGTLASPYRALLGGPPARGPRPRRAARNRPGRRHPALGTCRQRRPAGAPRSDDGPSPLSGARHGDWNGLLSHVGTVDDFARGFTRAGAGFLPAPPPHYAFSPSAMDASLVPPGRHFTYLAYSCAPAVVADGWERQAESFAAAMADRLEAHAPGFRETVVDLRVRTPQQMADDLGWPAAHPTHLDITLDQLVHSGRCRRWVITAPRSVACSSLVPAARPWVGSRASRAGRRHAGCSGIGIGTVADRGRGRRGRRRPPQPSWGGMP
ncbi:MAG: hypothetical protein ACRDYZ_08235 [Acidimicrobiales bacterium]